MSPADCYHFGLIVPDIDAAATGLTQLAGYQWTRPIEAAMTIATPTGETTADVAFVYSVQAPHIELVRAVPGTPWTTSPDSAAHHLGFWVDDMAAAVDRLESAGYARELEPLGDLAGTFGYYVHTSGVRIELVARKYFTDWPGFLHSMAR
ncbi:bleomycin resistance protein [Mycobacterium colombiense]|uniref:Bleomycin resistance protein n=1 Tax=Mycobacterium colombiense TaxID=339268 RepID=A0A1A2YG37_9MYCO|nr:bleomycin resistance protein [Mycobacterium colombiense]